MTLHNKIKFEDQYVKSEKDQDVKSEKNHYVITEQSDVIVKSENDQDNDHTKDIVKVVETDASDQTEDIVEFFEISEIKNCQNFDKHKSETCAELLSDAIINECKNSENIKEPNESVNSVDDESRDLVLCDNYHYNEKDIDINDETNQENVDLSFWYEECETDFNIKTERFENDFKSETVDFCANYKDEENIFQCERCPFTSSYNSDFQEHISFFIYLIMTKF